MKLDRRIALIALLCVLVPPIPAQVTEEQIRNADQEPGNWLTYSRSYMSQHYSPLDQIKTGNVSDLDLKWVFQAEEKTKFQSTPLVVDGVLYVTHSPNHISAIDALTGRLFWKYHHTLSEGISVCCGRVNRGTRDPRRHAVPGHARRAIDGLRRQDRRGRVGREDCQ